VAVRGRHLDEGHVDVDDTSTEEGRDPRKGDGSVVPEAAIDRLPGTVADEKRVVAEVELVSLVGIGRHTQGPHVDDLGAVDRVGRGFDELDEGSEQVLGFPAGGTDKDGASTPYAAERLFHGNELFREFLPEHAEVG